MEKEEKKKNTTLNSTNGQNDNRKPNKWHCMRKSLSPRHDKTFAWLKHTINL